MQRSDERRSGWSAILIYLILILLTVLMVAALKGLLTGSMRLM